MARMHKLNFLSGIEGSNEIEFPRLQKRLLQCEEETTQTFELFDHDEIDKIIYRAKAEAVAQALMCGIAIPSYDDVDILEGIVQVIESAVTNDGEDDEYSETTEGEDDDEPQEDPITLHEDLVNIRLSKESSGGLPVYGVYQKRIFFKKRTRAPSCSMANNTFENQLHFTCYRKTSHCQTIVSFASGKSNYHISIITKPNPSTQKNM